MSYKQIKNLDWVEIVEGLVETTEMWIYIATIRIMVRGLAWFNTRYPPFQTPS